MKTSPGAGGDVSAAPGFSDDLEEVLDEIHRLCADELERNAAGDLSGLCDDVSPTAENDSSARP